MTDAILNERISDAVELCISTISRSTFDAHEVDGLGDDNGYFIYERESDGSIREILAKCPSFEAAAKLFELIRTLRTAKVTATAKR
jgi:predicted neutral ceramidase superfamily lipid hydrolase